MNLQVFYQNLQTRFESAGICGTIAAVRHVPCRTLRSGLTEGFPWQRAFYIRLKEMCIRDRGETVTTKISLTAPLSAPVLAGSRVGEAIFFLDGQEVGRVPLLCGMDVLPEWEPAMATLKAGLPQ